MLDDQLKLLIEAAIVADDRLSSESVHLEVNDGVVTLTGAVQSYRRKLAAHELVSHFHGVRDIVNEISVEPTCGTPDDDVAQHVRLLLESHADIHSATVTVAVSAGVATLSGHVATAWERTHAEEIARAARGVRDVHNLLIVNPFETAADEQMAERIREALIHARGLREADIRVAINESWVVLSGEVEHLWQKDTAQVVAERFRPTHLRNDIRVTQPPTLGDIPT